MADLLDLKRRLHAQVMALVDVVMLGTETTRSVGVKMADIVDTQREAYNLGHAAGWDAHALIVAERLSHLAEIGMTAEQFANLPVPDLEGF